MSTGRASSSRFPNRGSRFSLSQLVSRNPPQLGVCDHQTTNILVDETERISLSKVDVGADPTAAQISSQGLYPEGQNLYTTSRGTMNIVASLNPTQFGSIETGRDLFEMVCKDVGPHLLPLNWVTDVE